MAKRKSRFPSYGLVRGASHAQGGVAGMVAGEQPVELEGGEWIIPKEAVPDYLPVLKQITNEGRAMQQMDNGNTAMDALIASASMENGITQPKSPVYQEGGEVAPTWGERFISRFPSQHQDPERAAGQQRALAGLIDFFAPQSAAEAGLMLAAGPIIGKAGRVLKGAKGLPKLSKKAKDFITRSKEGEHLEEFARTEPGMAGPIEWSRTSPKTIEGRRRLEEAKQEYGRRKRLSAEAERYEAKYADDIAQSLNTYDNPQVDVFMDDAIYNSGMDIVEALAARKAKFGYEQGGMVNQYGHGGQTSLNGITDLLSEVGSRGVLGQMKPRRQQEMRNPEVYGPPVPANLDSVLKQIMMRDVNQSINPFTGKSLDFEGDSLRLLQRMNESRGDTTRTGMPLSPYGQNLQRGGLVMYANGGQIGEGQPLERRYGEAAGGESPGGYFPLASQAEPGALMGSIRSDRRIKPLQPDTYLQKIPLAKPFYKSNLAHPLHQEEVEEVPKLSTAYLASFGMETPLSRRQGALLYRKGIAPQTLNPQVKGLINRALVQRLTNEDD